MSYGKITEKQKKTLDYIKWFLMNKGYPPSIREIGEGVGLSSTASVYAHISKLEENGYIRRDGTKTRAIEILDDTFNEQMSREISSVPIVGDVAAGTPLLAVENIEQYFPIPVDYLPNTESFILKVRGDSMINAGILDGDQVLVASVKTAQNGDIVVALIDDSATVKTFYKEADHIRLQPENDDMDPIIVTDCRILGKVFGVLRFF